MPAAARLPKPPALARVMERVVATVRSNRMLEPNQTVLVCVSGGPDSVCLVESLVRLRRLFRVRLEVFHLDHRLREGSAADARYVARLAERLGLPFHLREVDERPGHGASVEAWARDRRIAAAGSVAAAVGAERIAEGHTLDDQAETLLIALVRGGGLSAMAGIAPVRGPEIQPLLDVTRAEVEAACRSLHVRPRTDPTNGDTRFLRNAIRLVGLPALEAATGRELRATFARAADHLRIDEEELSNLARAQAEILVRETPAGRSLDARGLLALSESMRGRVIRLALYGIGVVPTNADIEGVADLARGRPGRRRDLTDSGSARRTAGTVELARP